MKSYSGFGKIRKLLRSLTMRTTSMKVPKFVSTKFEHEDKKFSVEEFNKAFENRNTLTLNIVSLNGCGGLPFPQVKPKKIINWGRKTLYKNPEKYNKMMLLN